MAVFGITDNTDTATLSQLVASNVHEQKEITLKASAGALSRGTVLEMTSVAAGQWQQMQASGGANARAILLEDVSNSTSTQKVQAYFVGKYRETDLIWPAGITTLQKRTAIVGLQDRGILIDDAILDVATTTTTTTTTTSSSSTTTTTTA